MQNIVLQSLATQAATASNLRRAARRPSVPDPPRQGGRPWQCSCSPCFCWPPSWCPRVIDQLVPKVSSAAHPDRPGARASRLFAPSSDPHSAWIPDLFLVLFIAPLLYDEAKSVDKAALVAQPQARALARHRAGGGDGARAWDSPCTLGDPVHHVWRRHSRSGAALGPTDAVAVASLSKETNIRRAPEEHPGRRVAHQRRLRHRVVPVRARGGRHRVLLPPGRLRRTSSVQLLRRHPRWASFWAIVGNFLVRQRALHRAWRTRRSTCSSRCSRPSSSTWWPRRLRRERHHRRGGGRPGERHLAACHRAVHLAHEHRLVQRLARRCPSPSTASCSCCWARSCRNAMQPHLGRRETIDNFVLVGVTSWLLTFHAASLSASSGCSPWSACADRIERRRTRIRAEQGRPERSALVDGAGRAEGHHHAGRACSPYPLLVDHRCGHGHLLSPARPHHLPRMRRHRGHAC